MKSAICLLPFRNSLANYANQMKIFNQLSKLIPAINYSGAAALELKTKDSRLSKKAVEHKNLQVSFQVV